MSRIRIELQSSGDIELMGDVSAPLSFSIADIRNPESRNGSFSKTIKIPGTKNNNKIFKNIFDVNLTDCLFDARKKAKATLYIDDIPQLKGNLQLLNITKDDENKIGYEVALFGKTSNIFIDLADTELTDLDISEFDHTYTQAVQAVSWSATPGSGYVYPMIDYGFDNDINSYDTEHLLPAVYLKTYVDKIFKSQGYTYTSSFFDSSFFKRLIVPATGSSIKLTDAQITPMLFSATDSLTRTYAGNSASVPIIIQTEVSDVSNQFDNVTNYTFTATYSAYYNFKLSVNYYLQATGAYTSGSPTYTKTRIYKVGGTWSGGGSDIQAFYPAASGDISSTGNIYCNLENVLVYAGEVVHFEIYSQSASYPATPCPHNIKTTAVVLENSVVNSGVLAGGTIAMNKAIPEKIKQKDFLSSVVKAFNLYIDVDTSKEKNLIIETRDDFYASGTTIDWSSKLDLSNTIEYTPLGELGFRTMRYAYKADKDYYNGNYTAAYGLTYGEYYQDTGNEFVTSENKTEIIFSPTPLNGENANDRIVSRIWQVDNGNITVKPFNIRLLYYGGLLSCNPWNHTQRVASTVVRNSYPFAGHLDNPITPTIDLNFGVPREIYYNATAYTDNNLFNAYHKKFIDEITDKDSKIVTAYFDLNLADIFKLDFRNQFKFDNQLFRLNKVIDYDPVNTKLTKCEFIKIKNARRFVKSAYTITGGTGTMYGHVVFPTISTGFPNGTKDLTGTSVFSQGLDNTLGGGLKNVIVSGDQNSVSSLSSNVNLIGSSGCIISPGVNDVTIFNTDDVTVTSGDVTIINSNVFPVMAAPYGNITPIAVTTKTYQLKVYEGTILVTTGATNTTITLLSASNQYMYSIKSASFGGTTITYTFGKQYTIKKVDSGVGQVVIDPNGAQTIDGAATYTLVNQYDAITIQSDGSNWNITSKK